MEKLKIFWVPMVILGLFLSSVFATGNFHKYFENEEEFNNEYASVNEEYVDAEKNYRDAERGLSQSCTKRLLTRCRYVSDKLFDFERIDDNPALFCKQSQCYSVFNEDLSGNRIPLEINECIAADRSLDLCVDGKNHRKQSLINLGMQKDRTYLVPPRAPFYKIERMIYAQNQAFDMGFSKEEAQAIIQQLSLENEAWATDTMGDWWCKASDDTEDYCNALEQYGKKVSEILYPCSFGLVQYNACVHYGQRADHYYRDNEEWHDYKYQVDRLIKFLANKKEQYEGDFEKAQIHWNYPVAALGGYHKTVPYHSGLMRMKKRFEDLGDALGAIEFEIN